MISPVEIATLFFAVYCAAMVTFINFRQCNMNQNLLRLLGEQIESDES